MEEATITLKLDYQLRDMTPVRELRIRKDKIGEYVIHNHKRYYID